MNQKIQKTNYPKDQNSQIIFYKSIFVKTIGISIRYNTIKLQYGRIFWMRKPFKKASDVIGLRRPLTVERPLQRLAFTHSKPTGGCFGYALHWSLGSKI